LLLDILTYGLLLVGLAISFSSSSYLAGPEFFLKL
jgi:hypothetical protein